MNLQELATIARNVGFQAEVTKTDVIVSLKNRAVTTNEVAMAMNIPVQSCKRDGATVRVSF